MSLSTDDVRWVAHLARLNLSEDERRQMTEQLSAILDYVQQLQQLDTTGVQPLAHPLDVHDIFRPDEPHASLDADTALRNAPKRNGEFYSVPAVLD